MKKLLTVSVAAYNVEKTLSRALDSCCAEGVREYVEVIVVNDGSKDATLNIIKSYCELYPNTFKLIDKENGGYGSTLNLSMKVATGKYFRLLDGDDCFDNEGIHRLLSFLSDANADLILSGRLLCKEDGETMKDTVPWIASFSDEQMSKTFNLIDIKSFPFGVWHATIKTSVLQEYAFELPTHCLYTDALFLTYFTSYITTVTFLNYDVYCYYVGNDEQSVSIKSIIANIADFYRVFEISYEYYRANKNKNLLGSKLMTERVVQTFNNHLVRSTVLLPSSHKNLAFIQKWDKKIKREEPEFYKMCGKRSKRTRWYRRTFYQLYWLEKLFKVKVSY